MDDRWPCEILSCSLPFLIVKDLMRLCIHINSISMTEVLDIIITCKINKDMYYIREGRSV